MMELGLGGGKRDRTVSLVALIETLPICEIILCNIELSTRGFTEGLLQSVHIT
jgi:hypothetical protein